MKLIYYNKKDYYVPEKWDELTAEQLLEIMDTLYIRKYEPVQLVQKLMKSIFSFSFKKFFQMKEEFMEEYMYLVQFLFQEKIEFTRQLIPVYEQLYGPADEIGNMKADEFVFSESYHQQWWENKTDETALNKFVAVIYRPAKRNYDFRKNPDGDCRNEFNENISAYYAEHVIRRWPMNVKLAIATWYAGCRQQLVDDNPDVFGGNGEPAMYGLISILRAIAEKGTYGNFDRVRKMLISTMMIEMNETVAEGKRLEEQMKANK